MDIRSRLDAAHLATLEDSLALDLTDIGAARAAVAARRNDKALSAAAQAVTMSDHHVPGPAGQPDVLVRLYRPPGLPVAAPALYQIHGGGTVLGSVTADDDGCRELAAATSCLVASPEYRLAPEYPHPAPVEDCYAGLVWLAAHAAELGVDPDRIAVGGASAGGGLAAGVALLARDRGGPRIVFQLLIFPMLDDRHMTPSSQNMHEPKTWNTTSSLLAWRALLGEDRMGGPDVPIYAAPARATDLSGLPPAYIAVGDVDLYLDEDIGYAVRLGRAGVPAELHVYPGAFHGDSGGAPDSPQGRRWRRDVHEALREALGVQF